MEKNISSRFKLDLLKPKPSIGYPKDFDSSPTFSIEYSIDIDASFRTYKITEFKSDFVLPAF